LRREGEGSLLLAEGGKKKVEKREGIQLLPEGGKGERGEAFFIQFSTKKKGEKGG